MTIYIIYKTTNQISGRYYVGRHKVNKDNIEDGYLGSGVAIKDAIKSYGKENFIRETLFTFESEDDAILKEAEVVNEELMNDKQSYNLCTGGMGGRKHSAEARAKIVAAQTGIKKTEEQKKNLKGFRGRTHSEESKRKVSETKKAQYAGKDGARLREALQYERTPQMRENISKAKRNMSDETRRKMSESGKARAARERAAKLLSSDK